MELTAEGTKVLEAVLDAGAQRAPNGRTRFPPPGADDVSELCNLIGSKPTEQNLQSFLESKPGFISGLLGGPDNTDLALLFKPPIGNEHFADFGLLQSHQGGSVLHLVELESCNHPLYTKQGRDSQYLNHLNQARKQVRDWGVYIERNRNTFIRQTINLSKKLTVNHQTGSRSGLRVVEDPEQMERILQAFGGFDAPFVSYTIVIGRWSQLSSDDRIRLLQDNRQRFGSLSVFTYEQFIRGANWRLERDDWFNEHDYQSSSIK